MSRIDENFKAAVKDILDEQGETEAFKFLTARGYDANEYLFEHFGIPYYREEEEDTDTVTTKSFSSEEPIDTLTDEEIADANIDTTKEDELPPKSFFRRTLDKLNIK